MGSELAIRKAFPEMALNASGGSPSSNLAALPKDHSAQLITQALCSPGIGAFAVLAKHLFEALLLLMFGLYASAQKLESVEPRRCFRAFDYIQFRFHSFAVICAFIVS